MIFILVFLLVWLEFNKVFNLLQISTHPPCILNYERHKISSLATICEDAASKHSFLSLPRGNLSSFLNALPHIGHLFFGFKLQFFDVGWPLCHHRSLLFSPQILGTLAGSLQNVQITQSQKKRVGEIKRLL